MPPSRSPASMVKRYWSVNGTTGPGILIHAPAAISATNMAHKIILVVLLFFKPILLFL